MFPESPHYGSGKLVLALHDAESAESVANGSAEPLGSYYSGT